MGDKATISELFPQSTAAVGKGLNWIEQTGKEHRLTLLLSKNPGVNFDYEIVIPRHDTDDETIFVIGHDLDACIEAAEQIYRKRRITQEDAPMYAFVNIEIEKKQFSIPILPNEKALQEKRLSRFSPDDGSQKAVWPLESRGSAELSRGPADHVIRV